MTNSIPYNSNNSGLRCINLVRISHVYYTHRDINKARQFLEDFGFQEVKRVGKDTYYRGTGFEPFVYCAREGDEDEFGGAAFTVESEEDLEYASRTLPGASKITEFTDAPGSGLYVTFRDPADNFPFHLVYGQKCHDDVKTFPPLKFNFGTLACVTNFAKAFEFYTTRFNFKPSDLVYDGNGRDITTFLHLDRDSEKVDHHCFFFFEGSKSHVHHSYFETHNFDTQVLGHDWLRHKGYENCWGVGRHVMGSQIFDYWFDTSRFILEHYVDGDLVDDEHPINRSQASPDNLHVWGPDLPPEFLL
ncbi:uncharacterized protein N7498_007720 [Penicillium cinerascens]|uniref:VOC domain-containing protein n=1 Tax=Penicillium cinerascens TaxID=70096 RepID=A0A9W9JKJ2_9EURO|nr:uncharacterized protein N7498_007720 [Penicillium cinerascens]KAJ5198603.1 hypothetical protein N7498_007720 [Penicillium cinerascens]